MVFQIVGCILGRIPYTLMYVHEQRIYKLTNCCYKNFCVRYLWKFHIEYNQKNTAENFISM